MIDPLIGVTLVVFIAFFGAMIVILSFSRFKTKNTDIGVFECLSEECVTNIQSGFKRCPTDSTPLRYDPALELCNPRYLCSNPRSPYSVQSDNSTSITGVCEPDVECGCLPILKCPDYVLSTFTSVDGSVFADVTNSRTSFHQAASFVNSKNETSNTPPLEYLNPSTTFCKAPVEWLTRSTPGCNFINQTSPTFDELSICMGLPNNCNGVLGNPCLQGTLAIISADAIGDDLTKEEIGCVQGESCPCGQIAVYNTNLGQITCVDVK